MKTFFATGTAISYSALCVSEIGAAANWWEPISYSHWWLAGVFFFVVVYGLRDVLSAGKSQ